MRTQQNRLVKSGVLTVAVGLLSVLAGCCHSSSGYVMNMSGKGYYRVGQYSMAAHEFRQAIANDPHNADYRANLAMALSRSGDVDLAERTYRQAIDVNPVHQASYHGLAELLVENNRQPEAVALMNSYIGVADYQAEPHLELAWLQKKLGNSPGELAALQTAAKRTPNSPQVLAKLGESYERAGNTTAAVQAYQKSLQTNIAQPEIQNRIARLTGQSPSTTVASVAQAQQTASLARNAEQLAQQRLEQQRKVTAQMQQQLATTQRQQQLAMQNQQRMQQQALARQAMQEQTMQHARRQQAWQQALAQESMKQQQLRQQMAMQQQTLRQQAMYQQRMVRTPMPMNPRGSYMAARPVMPLPPAVAQTPRSFAPAPLQGMVRMQPSPQMAMPQRIPQPVMPRSNARLYPPSTPLPGVFGIFGNFSPQANAPTSPQCSQCDRAPTAMPGGMVPLAPSVSAVPGMPVTMYGAPQVTASSALIGPPPMPGIPTFEVVGESVGLAPSAIDEAELPRATERVTQAVPEVSAF